MTVWHLLNGSKPIVRLIQDGTWPHLSRIEWADGVISPPANVTRCKDAARKWIATEYKGRINADRLRWEKAVEGGYSAESDPRGQRLRKAA